MWLLLSSLGLALDPAFVESTLSRVEDHLEARFPLKTVPPTPLLVQSGSPRREDDGATLTPFEARIESRPSPVLILSTRQTIRAGSYDVGVLAGEEVLNLKIIRPASHLEVNPETLSLQQDLPFPTPDLVLYLRETSGIAGVGDVEVSYLGGVTEAGSVSAGRLTCGEKLSLGPSENQMLRCFPEHFEHGLVKGMLRISGSELAAPVDVPVEVKTTFSSVLIPFVVMLGILLAWLVRGRLNERVEMGEAILEAEKLADDIEKLWRAAKDTGFRTQLGTQKSRLEEVLREMDGAAALRAELLTLRKNLTDTTETFEKEQEELAARLQRLSPGLTPRWNLPTELAGLFSDAGRELSLARVALEKGTPTEARSRLEKIGQLSVQLADASRSWANNLSNLLRNNQSLSPALQALSDRITPAVERLTDPETKDPETSDLRERLRDVHDLEELLSKSLPDAVRSLSQELGDGLKDLASMNFPAFSSLRPELARAAELPNRSPMSFLTVDLPWGKQMLEKAAQMMMEAKVPGMEERKVQQLMEAGQYRNLVKYLRNPAGLAGGNESASERPAVSLPLRVEPAATPESAPLSLPSFQMSPVARQESTRAALDRARFWRQTMIGILTAILGWSLLDDTWVGSLQDFVGALAWGLTVPLTTEELFGLAARLTPDKLKG